MFYVVTLFYFFCWVVLCTGCRPALSQLMYYTMAQEKRHPTVLKGRRTQCRHYSIFEVMQYEPQSATFQL